jgi:hypothetical protein
MHGSELVIPLVFFLVVGAIWGSVILTRHKERMTMLDKGMSPEDIKQLYVRGAGQVNPFTSLKWGMVFVAVGLAVLIGMWLRANYSVDEGIYPALVALFGGTGLIVFYALARRRSE